MAESKFVYNARFVGRKPVEGPLNDFRLSEVVSNFQAESSKKTGALVDTETRCNVEFSDKNLLVTYIKKDEGFESDTESAKSVENNPAVVSGDKAVSDEKIIKDHVFRFTEPGGDDSYSSNSGGSGSDSETSDHNNLTTRRWTPSKHLPAGWGDLDHTSGTTQVSMGLLLGVGHLHR